MAGLEIGVVRDEGALGEYPGILTWAFGGDVAKSRKWIDRVGLDNVLLAREGERVIAGLAEIPMGQWFGGKSLPMLGIAGVAVAADARGRGVARELMKSSLTAARQRGIALSTLYPATLPLYRAFGYELAGGHYRFSMRADDVPKPGKNALEVSPVTTDDVPEIERLYREVARHRTGYLDRGSLMWKRVRESDDGPVVGAAARSSRGIEGYVFMEQVKAGPSFDVSLNDFVVSTPAALAAILRFLAHHRSTAYELNWRSGVDTRFFAFPEPTLKCELRSQWMLRLLDVEKALAGRGYPGRTGEVELRVEDELFPENAGHYRLRVRDGEVSLERGTGAGGVPIHVGALASLYSGYASAHELALAGVLKADEATLDRLSALFAGPAPASADAF